MPPDALESVRLFRSEVIEPLSARFAGREELIELIALALSASENLLIVGPPGTAKSRVVSELASRITGRYFEYLLTRFTEPSEVFGPVDLKELREGRMVTRTEGMLPEAEIAFLDEVFHAGSAILNSLLGIINDGVFRRGIEVRRTGLISIIGATNRIPEDPALRALEDRFTLRVEVRSMEPEHIPELLERGWSLEGERLRKAEGTVRSRFGTEHLRRIHAALAAVDLRPVRERIAKSVRRIRAAGVFLSDRRAVKLQALVAASAALCGRSEALPSDLWPVRYLWEAPEDASLLEEIVEEESAGERTPGETHPLSQLERRPAELLAKALLVEAELESIGGAAGGNAADEIHGRLRDLDAERRSCKARSSKEEDELRELGRRLESMAAALGRKAGST